MLNPTPDVNDASRVTWRSFLPVWSVVTAIFTLYLLIALLAGRLPPTPNLATPYTTDQWQQIRAEQTKQLQSFGWVDEEAGIVHIPIDLAKEQLLEQGLPVQAGGN